MANFKRGKPKKYLHIDCCRFEAWYCSGNDKWRRAKRDLRQPQFYTNERANPHRYKTIEY